MDITDLNQTLSDEEELPTASKILQAFTTAWINEKNCPELLQHETDLVDCLMDQIQQMEENLQNLSRNDFRLVPHQMEIDRIRYLISSYLRNRLEKIEQYSFYLLQRDRGISQEDERYLSKAEFQYAEDFLKNFKLHCDNEAFRYMPPLFHNFGKEDIDLEVKPNLLSTVFIRVVKTIPGVVICDQLVDLTSGSRHLLPYKDVAQLIKSGSVLLI